MRGLKASLWKDFKVFKDKTGLIAIIAPLLLALAMSVGGADIANQAYLKPFPVAVRDEDETIMSRTIIQQMTQIELFSEIIAVNEAELDQSILQQGVAAIITIPKDFFYTMYTFDNTPVNVVLNESMGLESSIFSAVFVSVMDIIGTNQSVSRAVLNYCYGNITTAQETELWGSTAEKIIKDTLGRQQIFDSTAEMFSVEATAKINLFSTCLSTLCMFFALSCAKSLSEEKALCILNRYSAAKGSLFALFASKLIIAALLALPSIVALALWFGIAKLTTVLIISAVILSGAFGIMIFIAACSRDSSSVQRFGNVLMLVSLVAGGSLYAEHTLPSFARFLSNFTLTHYARQALEQSYLNEPIEKLLISLLPVLIFTCFAFAAAYLITLKSTAPIFGKSNCKKLSIKKYEADVISKRSPMQLLPGKIFYAALLKCKSMSNGIAGFAILIITALLCGGIASSAVSTENQNSLSTAAVIHGNNPYAQALVRSLDDLPNFTVHVVNAKDGQKLLESGKVEGILTLPSTYSEAVKNGEKRAISYESAKSASSAQAAREIIAGQVIKQKAQLNGLKEAESRLGKALNENEQKELFKLMETEAASLAPLHNIGTLQGSSDFTRIFAPSLLGLSQLCIMFTVFTWAVWITRNDSQRVAFRARSLHFGMTTSYFSDILALFIVGTCSGFFTLLFFKNISFNVVASVFLYIYCIVGLALLITRFSGIGSKIDTLAPFAALVLSMLGGCFGNFASASPVFKQISAFTPQGLSMNAASTGNMLSFFGLAAIGSICIVFAKPTQKHKQ
ncbi:MAG: ABC transporter permease [Christensenella sp.]